MQLQTFTHSETAPQLDANPVPARRAGSDLAQQFRRRLEHPLDLGGRSEWYPGRPVMVLANDYVLKLFNGDVGIVLPDASGAPMVFFPQTDGGFRAVAPLRLPRQPSPPRIPAIIAASPRRSRSALRSSSSSSSASAGESMRR